MLGRIPANRLYQTGINLLNLYPQPNINGAGLAYNYELTRPEEKALAQQPAIRIDYQPTQKLRATAKYSGFIQRNQVFNGTLPGFNDAQQQDPVIYTFATTVNAASLTVATSYSIAWPTKMLTARSLKPKSSSSQ